MRLCEWSPVCQWSGAAVAVVGCGGDAVVVGVSDGWRVGGWGWGVGSTIRLANGTHERYSRKHSG